MIYCLMGKSASGKDTIYRQLLKTYGEKLIPLVPWTTRPIRQGETQGKEYHFTDEQGMKALEEAGRIVESRVYHTVQGDWYYFTAAEDGMDPGAKDYLLIGTLEVYNKISQYYGADVVCPLYVVIPDEGERLARALGRERKQKNPGYAEMCRRYLADEADFSEEKLSEAGVKERYENTDLNVCLKQICRKIDRG